MAKLLRGVLPSAGIDSQVFIAHYMSGQLVSSSQVCAASGCYPEDSGIFYKIL